MFLFHFEPMDERCPEIHFEPVECDQRIAICRELLMGSEPARIIMQGLERFECEWVPGG